MADRMTDFEFAAKCEFEGTEYALTEYGLTEDHLEPDSPLRPLVKKARKVAREFQAALDPLELAMEKVLEEGDTK